MKYGCKGSLPHQYETKIASDGTVCDFQNVLYETCVICGDEVKWNKNKYTGRLDSKEYLQAHIREFAQPYGRTGKVYEMLYGKPLSEKQLRVKGTNANH
jgi:hypothetical protein